MVDVTKDGMPKEIAIQARGILSSWESYVNSGKANKKIFVRKFSKNVKSKLYHSENSET